MIGGGVTVASVRYNRSMRPLLLVLATILMLPNGSARAEPPPDRPLVLAYYYPWYHKGDWTRHDYVGTPLLGEYGTDDPAIATKHIDWAADGGIDAFVVSWWGPDHLCAQHMATGLLRAKNLKRIRFCMIYESLGRLDKVDGNADAKCDFANETVRKQFVDDLKHLRKHYFNHAQYLKVGDKPVVVLYVTRTFRNFNRTTLDAAEKAAGVDVFVIADEPFFWDQADPTTARHGVDEDGRSVFDAYTPYNLFENQFVRDGESATAYVTRVGGPVYEKWSAKTVIYPKIMPSYKDFRGNKPLAGGVDGFVRQLEVAARMRNPPNRRDAPRMLFITSFNEWWEGTTIEPAKEYGSSYLDALVKWKRGNSLSQKARP